MTKAERKKLREKARKVKASRVKAKEKAKKVKAKRKKLREKEKKVRIEIKNLKEKEKNRVKDFETKLVDEIIFGKKKSKIKTIKYKGQWLHAGTEEEEKREIDRKKSDAAIKAARSKNQNTKNLGIKKTKKKVPTGDKGFGMYKNQWLISGTQEEMSEIDWMKHENAIKAAIRKDQAVEEMISTEESSVCRNNWLKIRAG